MEGLIARDIAEAVTARSVGEGADYICFTDELHDDRFHAPTVSDLLTAISLLRLWFSLRGSLSSIIAAVS
jgi:hypothetical protein